MKIEFLGAYGGSTNHQNLTSFIVDDRFAIDAGALAQSLSLDRQYAIDNIIISHSHLDHTLSLPFLADNIFGQREKPLRIWSTQTVLDALEAHIFNEVTWPDFQLLPSAENPTIELIPLTATETTEIDGYAVTPIPVNHVIPCTGFLVVSNTTGSAVLYTADTTRTDEIWICANKQPKLDAVIVDCSFPNDMEELAIASGHMTPAMLGRELEKLEHDCPVLIYHIKPIFEEVMVDQLEALRDKRVVCNIQGRTMTF
jgi:ribonuclease BN (tRNA processing enzyme)